MASKETGATRPQGPGATRSRPAGKAGAKSGRPGPKSGKPGPKPGKPGAKPERRDPKAGAKPGKPGSKAAKPGAKSGKPGAKSGKPVRREVRPGEKTGKPSARPRNDDRPRGPRVPEEITGKELDRRVAAELRTLPEGLAEQVARLLVAASSTIDDDPEAALAFALEAKRKAGRVSVVREAVGLAAYAAGDYAQALAELRAVRRMTGDDAHLPLMADCERGLGRPRKALELLSSVPEDSLDDAVRVESRIVASGARRDLGQPEAALVLLQIPALNARRTEPWLARLRYAYADLLLELGRPEEARTWFERAAAADLDGETDAAERLAEMDGVIFEEVWGEDEVVTE